MAAFRDVVILLPGIIGSVLARADGKEVWSTSAGAIWRLASSGGDSVHQLALPADGKDDGITAPRLMPDVTLVPGLIKIDGYTRIQQELIAHLGLTPGQNFFPFPYDWRLDNRVHAARLQREAMDHLRRWRDATGNSDARLVLIAHSMGGLICRHFLECLEGWRVTRTLITLGTPHRGSLNALDFLVHGMKKGIGPWGLDLTPLLRSLPSVYQLLPTYPCIDTGGAQLARVAAAAGQLPYVDGQRADAARAFHTEIEQHQAANAQKGDYRDHGYTLVPIVGIEQPTYQTARTQGSAVELLRAFGGADLGGDGTVPRASATPLELSDALREIYAAECHGSLQNSDGCLANLRGLLTRDTIDFALYREAPPAALSLDLDDVALPGDPLVVRARPDRGAPQIVATLTHAGTGQSFVEKLRREAETGWQRGEFDLPAGVWRVQVSAQGAAPVTDLAVVGAA